MDIELVKYDYRFLDKSFGWLHDPEIAYLTDTSSFSLESQKKWYDSLSDKTDYIIWGVEYRGNPIGVCGLKKIGLRTAEYWGYIGEKQLHGLGLGTKMLHAVILKGKQLDLLSITLKLIKSNIIALNLYKKAGFGMVKEDNKFYYMIKLL